ncbi:putative NADH pyrophosphatase [Hyphodiscus hymeniophilus]|uniref:NAD(+) diphosphatase n=1 Tax=Hyphodiscus hymeniophilus TaxID=353542 RepID=A0A9P6VES1_9HELO|nr:putative NADH pyrophosphatase [Hyphodiscus hymeniophilus]
MSPQPDLPDPAHHDVDSMLSRKFGREVANYFSGSPLNRVSFLRANHDFVSKALAHPSTSFLLFNDLAPLAKDPSKLAYATHKEVEPLIGENPFKKTEEEMIKEYNSDITLPLVLFLGLDERKQEGFEHGIYKGVPYFAIDVTPKGTVEKEATGVIEAMKAKGLSFVEGRMHMTLNAPEAAIYAQARALIDWNARNPFCGGCGQPTLSINAGTKRVCPPTDFASLPNAQAGVSPAENPKVRAACATRKGISNLSFPRTDPTVIMAVVSHDAKRVLLGRSKRFPPLWYSTLAGFCEPAESVEEAVRREVWEESGVLLGRVVIHSTQPWPYPANLMIGAIGQALPDGEKIHLEHDPELEDAKWVDMDEVREALRVGTSGLGDGPGPEYTEGGLRLPPKTAIAHQLLTAVTDGFLGESPKI